MSSLPEPRFMSRLREIAEGKRPMPKTDARAHHYVLSFLLARWATPQKRDGKLYELVVASGDVRRTQPGKVSLQRDLYAVEKAADPSVMIVEAFLSIIEEHAADPIKNLSTLPATISVEDRATIAFFLALQSFRTPAGLAANRKLSELAAYGAVAAFLGNREAVEAHYRKVINPDASAEEIQVFARGLVAHFRRGGVKFKLPPEAPLEAMLTLASPMAAEIAALDWTLVEATDGEFIVNDRGLAMWDPTVVPPRGNAWASSAVAETTVPVNPTVCLKLTLGSEGFAVEQADKARVDDLNLRTYGWAQKAVFGCTQGVVADVRRAAEAAPDAVPQPQVPELPPLPGA